MFLKNMLSQSTKRSVSDLDVCIADLQAEEMAKGCKKQGNVKKQVDIFESYLARHCKAKASRLKNSQLAQIMASDVSAQTRRAVGMVGDQGPAGARQRWDAYLCSIDLDTTLATARNHSAAGNTHQAADLYLQCLSYKRALSQKDFSYSALQREFVIAVAGTQVAPQSVVLHAFKLLRRDAKAVRDPGLMRAMPPALRDARTSADRARPLVRQWLRDLKPLLTMPHVNDTVLALELPNAVDKICRRGGPVDAGPPSHPGPPSSVKDSAIAAPRESPVNTPFLNRFRTPRPQVSGSDVIGMPDAVRRFILRAQHPELDRQVRAAAASTLLLYGPPGTGKTTMVRLLASVLDVPLFVVKSSQLVDPLLGASSNNVRQLFDQAFAYARGNGTRVVLFIDEVDGLLSKRNGHAEYDRVTSEFLQNLDGFDPRRADALIFVAATNFPERLPDALKSRLKVQVEVPLPSAEALRDIFFVELKRVKNAVTPQVLQVICAAGVRQRMSGRDVTAVLGYAADEVLNRCTADCSATVEITDIDVARGFASFAGSIVA